MKKHRGIFIVLTFVFGIVVGIIFLKWYEGAKPAETTLPAHQTAPTPSPSVKDAGMEAPLSDRVKVSEPRKNANIAHTFNVKGEAPGNWFFEASFPVQVRDPDGNVIGRAIAQAKADWMTTKQVPFEAKMTIDSAYHGPATLILLRDNPSGLPEDDDSVSFDVVVE